jgi:hypothetical protein
LGYRNDDRKVAFRARRGQGVRLRFQGGGSFELILEREILLGWTVSDSRGREWQDMYHVDWMKNFHRRSLSGFLVSLRKEFKLGDFGVERGRF